MESLRRLRGVVNGAVVEETPDWRLVLITYSIASVLLAFFLVFFLNVSYCRFLHPWVFGSGLHLSCPCYKSFISYCSNV